VRGPQDNQHDAIVEALSQLYLNNEQDTIHNQEVILGPFQRPERTIKPQQKLIETIHGKKPPKIRAKCIYHAYVEHVQFQIIITIQDALNGPNVEEWKSTI
jgi:hypothetical protein